jgi:hypothetical protein
MHETCHRCGEELTSGPSSAYCSHGGAPQIYLRDYMPSDSGVAADSTGAVPPPMVAVPRAIDWQPAIRSAGIVALGGGLLTLLAYAFPMISLASWIWVISGSVIALGMYQKQRPLARMDAGIGARIGLVVGVLMAVALGVSATAAGLVARFGEKRLGHFDTLMSAQLHAQVKQMAATNPVPPEVLGFVYSPEALAGMMLTMCVLVALGVIVLSMVGGAFAGMMRAAKRA